MRVDYIHEKYIYIFLQPVEGGEELVYPSMHEVAMFFNVDSETFNAIERQRVSLENTKPIITMNGKQYKVRFDIYKPDTILIRKKRCECVRD